MTKQQAIEAMQAGKKVTHRYFTADEYIYMVDGVIYSEDGVRHNQFWEIRYQESFKTDWSLFGYSVVEIGTPVTIGQLKEYISKYSDDTNFVFRNQPLQTLFEVNDGDNIFIAYQLK